MHTIRTIHIFCIIDSKKKYERVRENLNWVGKMQSFCNGIRVNCCIMRIVTKVYHPIILIVFDSKRTIHQPQPQVPVLLIHSISFDLYISQLLSCAFLYVMVTTIHFERAIRSTKGLIICRSQWQNYDSRESFNVFVFVATYRYCLSSQTKRTPHTYAHSKRMKVKTEKQRWNWWIQSAFRSSSTILYSGSILNVPVDNSFFSSENILNQMKIQIINMHTFAAGWFKTGEFFHANFIQTYAEMFALTFESTYCDDKRTIYRAMCVYCVLSRLFESAVYVLPHKHSRSGTFLICSCVDKHINGWVK